MTEEEVEYFRSMNPAKSCFFKLDFGNGYEELSFLCDKVQFDLCNPNTLTFTCIENDRMVASSFIKDIISRQAKENLYVNVFCYNQDNTLIGTFNFPLHIVSASTDLDWAEEKIMCWDIISCKETN